MVAEPPQLNLDMRRPSRFTSIGVTLLVPLALAVLVLWTSPNFSKISEARTAPFGGDFLQEWVGGRMVSSDQRSELYDLNRFKEIQHDASLLGFEWTSTNYYPPVYPPGYYLLFSPMGELNYRVAAVLWLLCGLSAFCATLILLYRYQSEHRKLVPVFAVCSAFFGPLLFSFVIGHKSTILLFVFTATYLLLKQKKVFLAGLCFGLIAFKPHFVIVIALAMLWQRNWQFLGGLLLSCGAWLALCLLAGFDLTVDYYQFMVGASDYVNSSGYRLEMAHSFWSFFQLLLGNTHSQLAKVLAGASCFGALFWLVRMMMEKFETGSPQFAHQFSAMILVTVLVSPHFYHYDLTILLLPCWLGATLATGQDKQRDYGLLAMIVGFGILAGLFATIALSSSVQVSCLLMVAWLFLLNQRIGRLKDASETSVDSAITA